MMTAPTLVASQPKNRHWIVVTIQTKIVETVLIFVNCQTGFAS